MTTTAHQARRLWVASAVVAVSIFSSALVGQPITQFLTETGLLGPLFGAGLLLVAATVVLLGVGTKVRVRHIGMIIGVAAVLLLLLIRIEIPAERTHLIEYAVLATLIFHALALRLAKREPLFKVAAMAFGLTLTCAVLDEAIQFLVPGRVFDLRDLLFDTLSSFGAITFTALLTWRRRRKESV